MLAHLLVPDTFGRKSVQNSPAPPGHSVRRCQKTQSPKRLAEVSASNRVLASLPYRKRYCAFDQHLSRVTFRTAGSTGRVWGDELSYLKRSPLRTARLSLRRAVRASGIFFTGVGITYLEQQVKANGRAYQGAQEATNDVVAAKQAHHGINQV